LGLKEIPILLLSRFAVVIVRVGAIYCHRAIMVGASSATITIDNED
jgi:hypothetical protein